MDSETNNGSRASKKVNRAKNNHVMVNGESEELEQELVDRLEDLKAELKVERRCEVMVQLVQSCINLDVADDAAVKVAEQLADILKDQFEGKIFPDNPTPETIEDSLCQPLFVIFRTLCEISENDPQR